MKTEWKKGWKVVRKSGNPLVYYSAFPAPSTIGTDDPEQPCFFMNHYVEYRIGQKRTRIPYFGPYAVFKTREEARKFRNKFSGYPLTVKKCLYLPSGERMMYYPRVITRKKGKFLYYGKVESILPGDHQDLADVVILMKR